MPQHGHGGRKPYKKEGDKHPKAIAFRVKAVHAEALERYMKETLADSVHKGAYELMVDALINQGYLTPDKKEV